MTSKYRTELLGKLVDALDEAYIDIARGHLPPRDLWRALTDEELTSVYNGITAARVQARLNATYAPATDFIERFR